MLIEAYCARIISKLKAKALERISIEKRILEHKVIGNIKDKSISLQEERELTDDESDQKEMEGEQITPSYKKEYKIGNNEVESDKESQFLNPCSVLCDGKNKKDLICEEKETAKTKSCEKEATIEIALKVTMPEIFSKKRQINYFKLFTQNKVRIRNQEVKEKKKIKASRKN